MLHFICPVCRANVEETNFGFKCSFGHTFDKAKEGYYNLLLSNNKNSKDPGDNKEMVNARHAFLSLNHYKKLAIEISNIINGKYIYPITLLDAGVGTGFYIKNIVENRQNPMDTYLGVDISKHAVKIAAKENKNVECNVSSVFSLPYLDKSVDVITCIFSPYAMDEYKRVLKDDGILILASPKEDHLIELRSLLYKNVRKVEDEIPIKDFIVIDKKELKYSFTLNSNEEIQNLLTMTPYVYRAPLDAVESIKKLSSLKLTANFEITVLKK